MTDVDVTFTGPLFDGRAELALERAVDEAEFAVAERGVQMVRDIVGQRAAHPTGHFTSRVVADRLSGDRVVAHAPGLAYGPWLTGTARRNQISSFKGFDMYRRARQELDGQAVEIADAVIHQHVKELNG